MVHKTNVIILCFHRDDYTRAPNREECEYLQAHKKPLAAFSMLDRQGEGEAYQVMHYDDQRDLDFANEYNIDVIPVVKPIDIEVDKFKINAKAYTEDGIIINSDFLNGLHIDEAKEKIINEIEKKGIGKKKINFNSRISLYSTKNHSFCNKTYSHD